MKELKIKFKRLDNAVLMKVVQRDEKSNTDTFEFINNRFMIECKQKTFDVINIMNIYSDNVIEKWFETPKQAKNYIKRAKECIKAYNDSIKEKEVFDIENYKCKYVMHCETEEEANEFCKYLDSVGRKWNNGDCYLIYNKYIDEEKICFNFNKGMFGIKDNYAMMGYTILKFKDFTFEIKEKEDKPFPKQDDTYYYSFGDGDIMNVTYDGDKKDLYFQHINNFWQTEEECKRYDEIKQKEMELSHKFTKEEYNDDNIFKYIIITCHTNKSLNVVYNITCQYSIIAFKNMQDAQAFIDFCGYEDYCKYVLGVK